MSNYKPIYIDLNSGSKFYLDSPINSPSGIFKFFQTIPSNQWDISHGKNTTKFILIINDSEQFGVNDIDIIDDNNLLITFATPATGEATLIFF